MANQSGDRLIIDADATIIRTRAEVVGITHPALQQRRRASVENVIRDTKATGLAQRSLAPEPTVATIEFRGGLDHEPAMVVHVARPERRSRRMDLRC